MSQDSDVMFKQRHSTLVDILTKQLRSYQENQRLLQVSWGPQIVARLCLYCREYVVSAVARELYYLPLHENSLFKL